MTQYFVGERNLLSSIGWGLDVIPSDNFVNQTANSVLGFGNVLLLGPYGGRDHRATLA